MEVAGESEMKMTIEDMSAYAGTEYIKFEDLKRNGSRVEVIADCRPGNYDQADLVFESGAVLTLNKTSTRELIRAYGKDAREFIGKTIKAYAGQVPFKDGMTDAALVECVSPATSDGKLPPPKPKDNGGGASLDDDISF